ENSRRQLQRRALVKVEWRRTKVPELKVPAHLRHDLPLAVHLSSARPTTTTTVRLDPRDPVRRTRNVVRKVRIPDPSTPRRRRPRPRTPAPSAHLALQQSAPHTTLRPSPRPGS